METKESLSILDNVRNSKTPITPTDVVNVISNCVNSCFYIPVKVRGKTVTEENNSFAKLKDETSTITLYSLSSKKDALPPPDADVIVDGTIRIKHSRSVMYPCIYVNSYEIINRTNVIEEDNVSDELIKKKTPRGFWTTFESLLSIEKKPKVVVIHGKFSQVQGDFQNGFDGAALKYKDAIEFKYRETSLNDKELCSTIQGIKNCDAIFLIRGGGDKKDLERIGGIESIKAIIEVNKPFFVAIGHSFDKGITDIEKVADESFPTPSLAGTELGKVVYHILELKNFQKDVKPSNLLKEESKIDYKDKTKTAFSFKRELIWLIIGAIITFIVVLIFKK